MFILLVHNLFLLERREGGFLIFYIWIVYNSLSGVLSDGRLEFSDTALSKSNQLPTYLGTYLPTNLT